MPKEVRARKVMQVNEVQRVLLELPEQLVLTAKRVLPEQLVLMVKRVPLEPLELLVLPALPEQVGVAQLV